MLAAADSAGFLVRNKPYAFLGQYLVGNGLISEDQLDEAIRLQKESSVLVGTIALKQGFLDEDQLNHLIKRQIEVDEQIGTLAIQEGFMREDQLEAVLSIQGENHVYLGESLVRMGAISNEALNEALRDFEIQIVAQEQHVREEIEHLPVARELLVILDVVLRYFYRLGHAVHIVGRSGATPDYVEYLFCAEHIVKKQKMRYMGLGMPGLLVESMAQGARLGERFHEPGANAMENMSELTFNLNYLVCKAMKDAGLRVKHGSVFVGFPPRISAQFICIDVETATSPMAITYSY